jgi:hypothetical protein
MPSSNTRLILKAVLPLCAGMSIAALGFGSASAENPGPKAIALAQEAPAAPAVEVIFTGFARHLDKGASIFVRMTGEVPVEADRAGRRLTYRLSGAKLGVANNANPLPTEHFGPPVSNVALVASSAGVDLVIDLSNKPNQAPATHRLVSHGGLATLVVELPPESP